MTRTIEEIPLGSEGLDYVRERLRSGNTLAKYVLRHWPGFRQAYTLLPSGVPADSLADFKSGGVLTGGAPDSWQDMVTIPNTDSALCQRIRIWLEAAATNACIFENALAAPSDPSIAELRSVFFFEREVYHYVLSPPSAEDTIVSLLLAAKSLPEVIGVITKSSIKPPSLDRAHLSLEFLEALARDTEVIIVGAYDGESYVIVER